MDRETSTGRDNAIIGGTYGTTGTPRPEEARQRAVLAGEQEEMRTGDRGSLGHDDGSMGMSPRRTSIHDRAEQGKEKAATKIEHASEQIRSQAHGPAEPVGEKLAGTLDKTAGYLHEHETEEIIDDFRAYVRSHPMQAVVGAALGGFFLARFLP